MSAVRNTKHWLKDFFETQPDKLFLVKNDISLSISEFYSKVNGFSNYLANAGVKENDHVGLLFTHHSDFWIAVNAIWFLNAIPVPLNSRNTKEELSNHLSQAEIKYLVLNSETFNTIDKHFIEVTKGTRFLDYNSADFDFSKQQINQTEFKIDSTALMMFTSGSSGKAKIVVHTFKSLFENVKVMEFCFDLSSEDIWLASLPVYHIGGFMILVRSLLTTSVLVFPESLSQNNIENSLNTFSPTHISLVSTTMQRLLKSGTKPNEKLKYVFLGGGPLSTSLCLDAVSNGWPVVKVYGSTETCSMVTALLPNYLLGKGESAGLPIGNNLIQISNESKNDFGEVIVQSGSLFKEYYNDAASTNHKLLNGFYHTGDFGSIDAEGFLYINSRKEDIIITGGENVSVTEVETALKSLVEIDDAIVFGINDESWGQIVCAAIVSNDVNVISIKEKLKEKLGRYKIPKQFFFIDSIPRTEMGKVNREKLFKLINLDEF